MIGKFWTKRVWTALPLLISVCGPAKPASIEVAPVSVEMMPGVTNSTITITNHTAERTAIQVRGFAWSQLATEDKLVRTDDLVVSPPIFQLDKGEAQVVRVMLRRPPTNGEASYRLLVDELPSPQAVRAVQLALRLSLPVFAEAGRAAPDLVWRLEALANGESELRVLNRGGRRDRLINLLLTFPNGHVIKPEGLPNPYILPGVERHWRVSPEKGTGLRQFPSLHATGTDDMGPFDVLVPALR